MLDPELKASSFPPTSLRHKLTLFLNYRFKGNFSVLNMVKVRVNVRVRDRVMVKVQEMPKVGS